MTTFISRRELLRRAGIAGMAAVVPAEALASSEPASQQIAAPATAALRRTPQNLTAAESDVLDAIVARLIPTDATGPGATEARAAEYIDRALGGALAASRQAYSAGLAALDRYAQTSRRKGFVDLAAADQDAVLTEVEAGTAAGFAESSTAFFNLVRTHTIQGMFCDPYYGGNADFVGWDLIGYPGVRTAVGSDEQRLGANVPPNHKSAYDYEMFTKTTARAGGSTEMKDGD